MRPEWLTDEKLEQLYYDEDMTQSEIGEKVGVSHVTIGNWMRDSNIHTQLGSRPSWLTKNKLEKLYNEEYKSLQDIGDMCNVAKTSVARWMESDGIQRSKSRKPSKDTLAELYTNEELSQREIGELYGVEQATVSEWMVAYNINTRHSLPYHNFSHGYEMISTQVNGKFINIGVHRLVAIREYGLDAIKDMHVHHINEIPWDNRVENLEILTPEEHKRLHANNRERNSLGQFVTT